MDKSKIEKGVRLILEGIGEDSDRAELGKTPENVAEMLPEILAGIGKEFKIDVGLSESVEDDLIVIKNIPFYSMCEHHLLPFFGQVHIAYLPKNNFVAGFSTLTRLVENYAKRLQLQERLTKNIADSLMDNLNPEGVFVQVEATQLCVSMRGNKKDSVRTVTQAVRGNFSLDRLKVTNVF